MAARLTIAGDDHLADMRVATPVTIQLLLNGRSQLRCESLTGYLPARLSEVIAYAKDGITPIYGGLILQRTIEGAVPSSVVRRLSCEVVGFETYLDWAIVSLAYAADVDLQTVLDDLIAALPAGYGITLDATDYSGITLAPFIWDTQRASDCLREVCSRTGRVYRVSPAKVLSLPLPGGDAAPCTLTDADPHCRSVSWSDAATPGVTTVVLRCGTGTAWVTQTWIADGAQTTFTTDLRSAGQTAGYVLVDDVTYPLNGEPEIAAYFYLNTAVSRNFTDGETVTIGTKVYTFQDVLTDVDGHVLIGATGLDSLINLATATTLTGGIGVTYAASMTPGIEAYAYIDPRINVLVARARVSGPAGNGIPVSTDAVSAIWFGEGNVPGSALYRGQWAVPSTFVWDDASHTLTWTPSPTLEAGALVSLTYLAQYPFLVSVTTGATPEIVEVRDVPECFDPRAAQDTAAALLASLGGSPRTIEFESFEDGWAPGQSVVVDLVDRDLDATFAITDVDLTYVSDGLWRYVVRGTELSVFPGTYLDQWRALLGTDSVAIASSSASSSTLSVTSGGGLPAPHALGGSRFHAVQVPA